MINNSNQKIFILKYIILMEVLDFLNNQKLGQNSRKD